MGWSEEIRDKDGRVVGVMCGRGGSTDMETAQHYGGTWVRCRRCHP